jgi:agmatine deiminase
MNRRLPAEWEPQSAVLMAWPHQQSDWADCLIEAQNTFTNIIQAIAQYEPVILIVPPDEAPLPSWPANVKTVPLPTNDTWARDFGPITVEEAGSPLLLDYTFNGWGNKFAANLDNALTQKLHEAGAFGTTPRQPLDLILEGGSIESDGEGTLLTTAQCLLNPNRNPLLTKQQLEEQLKADLGLHTILWLNHGYLAGDDTDAHIDTLARLCPDKTIVYVACDDPTDEHYPELKKMETELQAFAEYRLLPLPWPAAQFDSDGARLPATYANYLVINGAVLVPTYNDPADQAALDVVQKAYPDRTIIGIDCRVLIRQHGSLHCVTMQLP